MRKIFICLFAFLLLAPLASADTKGEDIIRRNEALDAPGTSSSLTSIVLINQNGDKKARQMMMHTQEGPEGTNTFIEFLSPADVKGTLFQTIAHANGPDEQRIFFKALGSVRRISSANKAKSFLGTDLSYYDIEDHDLDEFTYRYLKDEAVDGIDCYVVEVVPKDKDAPYAKMHVWISREDYREYRRDCYKNNEQQDLWKTIHNVAFYEVSGYVMEKQILIENHLEKHKTLFQVEELSVDEDVDGKYFTVEIFQ